MSAHQLEVTIRGAQGSGKSRLAHEIADAAHKLGFAVDHKIEGLFVGGTLTRNSDYRRRILIAEELPASQVEPYSRWRQHSMARHVAILALVTLAIMAGLQSLFGVQ